MPTVELFSCDTDHDVAKRILTEDGIRGVFSIVLVDLADDPGWPPCFRYRAMLVQATSECAISARVNVYKAPTDVICVGEASTREQAMVDLLKDIAAWWAEVSDSLLHWLRISKKEGG